MRVVFVVVLSLARLWPLLSTGFDEGSPCNQKETSGKRAIVTGITGMLGSHIAEALLERGYDVWGFVRPRSNMRNIASFSSRISLETVELMDAWRTLRVVKKIQPDYIFHFAAQAFNSLSYDEPDSTLTTNIVTTLNILEALRELQLQHKTRVLIAGSSTAYGASTEEWDGPIPETAPLKPVSPYGVSKVSSEMLALQYGRTHNIQVIVPRFFIHLAPRGVEALALHQFAKQIAQIERGMQQPILHHGDLSTSRDITDIVDSAPVVVCLAEVAPSGTVVNIGSNMSYTMEELVRKVVVMSTVGDKIRLELDKSRLRAYDEKIVMADISLLRKLTGWRPSPDMSRLIASLLDYWRREVAFRHPDVAKPSTRTSGEL